ncbi:MAG TPA: S-adenosylmethionine:tRNA ribosyltransferase-isomerase, partial [Lysobacter sp.]
MKKSDFHYELPPELIAQVPLPERSASRLLVVPPLRVGAPSGHFEDRAFQDRAFQDRAFQDRVFQDRV